MEFAAKGKSTLSDKGALLEEMPLLKHQIKGMKSGSRKSLAKFWGQVKLKGKSMSQVRIPDGVAVWIQKPAANPCSHHLESLTIPRELDCHWRFHRNQMQGFAAWLHPAWSTGPRENCLFCGDYSVTVNWSDNGLTN